MFKAFNEIKSVIPDDLIESFDFLEQESESIWYSQDTRYSLVTFMKLFKAFNCIYDFLYDYDTSLPVHLTNAFHDFMMKILIKYKFKLSSKFKDVNISLEWVLLHSKFSKNMTSAIIKGWVAKDLEYIVNQYNKSFIFKIGNTVEFDKLEDICYKFRKYANSVEYEELAYHIYYRCYELEINHDDSIMIVLHIINDNFDTILNCQYEEINNLILLYYEALNEFCQEFDVECNQECGVISISDSDIENLYCIDSDEEIDYLKYIEIIEIMYEIKQEEQEKKELIERAKLEKERNELEELGNNLYDTIADIEDDEDMIGKLTGIILDSYTREEVMKLINNKDSLVKMVCNIKEILEEESQ